MPILADKFPQKECTFFASYISLVSKCQIQEHGLSDKFRICEIFCVENECFLMLVLFRENCNVFHHLRDDNP